MNHSRAEAPACGAVHFSCSVRGGAAGGTDGATGVAYVAPAFESKEADGRCQWAPARAGNCPPHLLVMGLLGAAQSIILDEQEIEDYGGGEFVLRAANVTARATAGEMSGDIVWSLWVGNKQVVVADKGRAEEVRLPQDVAPFVRPFAAPRVAFSGKGPQGLRVTGVLALMELRCR